jgi:hypothetical protein
VAASGNPGASNAQAAFAAPPQEHSLKPTCGALAVAQGTGRASDQAARCVTRAYLPGGRPFPRA